ncbi:hypothetical protein TIFTF001_023538 [Ficus carica]|uniref:CLAVATA3/ESR (CLE)-related protein n=1 Tax=Ficus carica TaxID=3494 RepID=A0AA88AL41_FICCA|nr:hypothetical protein TIFTF001_023538 [Ficus carica]
MQGLKPFLCTLLLLGVSFELLSLSVGEARPLLAATSGESGIRAVPLMKAAKQVLDESVQRHGGKPYKIHHQSPGGPDPRHH